MAAGFPIRIGNVTARTTEALYQACRYPTDPALQQKILSEASPMTAKMVGKPYRSLTRPDWNVSRIKVMRWCLRLKLVQHWTRFGELLDQTQGRDIVEDSRKDDFWGAIRHQDTFVGQNVLGRLLMELRSSMAGGLDVFLPVQPPSLDDFLLLDERVPAVDSSGNPIDDDMMRLMERDSTRVGPDSYDSREKLYRAVVLETSRHLRSGLTAKELAIRLGVSDAQMQRWLKVMVSEGIVTKSKRLYYYADRDAPAVPEKQLSLLAK